MTKEFEIYDPKTFYKAFVRRAYDEFLAAPADLYRVKIAVIQADTMAERYWHYFRETDWSVVGNTKSPREFRQYLSGSVCSDIQIVWDVHDGHKHVELRKQARKVTSAAQSGLQKVEGAFQKDAFSNAFQVESIDAIVTLDDGTDRKFSDVLKNVIELWETVLL
jgi:hypothetical protein